MIHTYSIWTGYLRDHKWSIKQKGDFMVISNLFNMAYIFFATWFFVVQMLIRDRDTMKDHAPVDPPAFPSLQDKQDYSA